MKKIAIYLACALVVIGCKKVDVEFSYSPAQPKAGETVKFSNTSSAGETWNWDFGDKSSSLTKNPTKVYRKPGTYLVTLVVDSAKYNTCSHSITIYDTIPTFVASTDSICHYTDVTLSANVYNPFGYKLGYKWELPETCVLTAGTLTSSSITVYFKKYGLKTTDSTCVGLTITQNDKVYNCQRNLRVYKTNSPAIVMLTQRHTVLRQHIINGYIDEVENGDGEDVHVLDLVSDTMVVFNDSVFYASEMQIIFPGKQVERVQIDAMTQKWYVSTAEGLYVANFNGQNMQLIDAEATGAIYVDAIHNQIYWATPAGLKAMPLIKSKNNIFSTQPILYNTISDIDRIVVNNSYR